MSFISPALIARIYQALGQDRGGRAVTLMRQHSFNNLHHAHCDADLIGSLVTSALKAFAEGDLTRAGEHFGLGLSLYERSFQDCHVQALQCVSGLLSLAYAQDRESDISGLVETSCVIVHRLSLQHHQPRALAV